MTAAAITIVDQAGRSLGGFLPRLGGALLLLLGGLLVAWIVGRLVGRALARLGVDGAAERWGVHDVLERVALPRSLSRVLGSALRLALSLIAVFAALSLLGLQFLSDSLNQAVLFLPNILAAGALLLGGVVVGALGRERVNRVSEQMDLPVPLGQVFEVVVIAVAAILAAAQLRVATSALLLVSGILLAAAAATFALAFGLGGREFARAVSAGRYVRGAFAVGQRISFGEVGGEITQIESAATVLRTDRGESVRIPNHVLLEAVVTVHEPAEGSAPTAS
jgi:small-conductance mechanosensitive channel